MNSAHIHILINHLPVFGSLSGGIVLALGMWTKNPQTKIAAYYLFILSAIGAGVAYFTGEPAEEAVEKLAGVTESAIERHEDFALFALISFALLGLLSVFGVLITIKQTIYMKPVAVIILCCTLLSFVLVARTGYLGGQIRHTEFSNSTGAPVQNSEGEDSDD